MEPNDFRGEAGEKETLLELLSLSCLEFLAAAALFIIDPNVLRGDAGENVTLLELFSFRLDLDDSSPGRLSSVDRDAEVFRGSYSSSCWSLLYSDSDLEDEESSSVVKEVLLWLLTLLPDRAAIFAALFMMVKAS